MSRAKTGVARRDIVRSAAWKRRGIKFTSEEYDHLLAKQDGRCAVCLSLPKEKRRLAVDHDHKTKIVRGLLCYYCNRFVVSRHRSGALLRRAADYLDRYI